MGFNVLAFGTKTRESNSNKIPECRSLAVNQNHNSLETKNVTTDCNKFYFNFIVLIPCFLNVINNSILFSN